MLGFMILFILIALFSVMAIINYGMARIDVEKPSEFKTTPRNQSARTGGAQPISGLTIATRLQQYRIVEDNPLDADLRTIQHATDGSLSVRGILMQTQQTLNDGGTGDGPTVDDDSSIPYVLNGPARVAFEEAVAKHTLFVAGTNGYARPYNALTDTANMILGRTECGCTAVGDIVDVELNLWFNAGGL